MKTEAMKKGGSLMYICSGNRNKHCGLIHNKNAGQNNIQKIIIKMFTKSSSFEYLSFWYCSNETVDFPD